MDQGVVRSLEAAVVEWSHQTQRVLKEDSSGALLGASEPTPQAELLFWTNRSELVNHRRPHGGANDPAAGAQPQL